ncbi:TPA_asm: hypothetical protein GacPV1_gp19 [Geoglobus acetivorans pleomorphic virus 1]|uniref:Uncharacterized protein n=2 Tax=root TaxID=1 RepID=A0A0A7GEG5_GEOAI|nr:hypothetical protein GACE_1442 [Geoglobus acetivorans]
MLTLDDFIEAGACPCGGALERIRTGWRCTRCGWEVVEAGGDA